MTQHKPRSASHREKTPKSLKFLDPKEARNIMNARRVINIARGLVRVSRGMFDLGRSPVFTESMVSEMQKLKTAIDIMDEES